MLCCLSSCSNDENVPEKILFDKSISFSYQGETYTSNYAIMDNDLIVYEDKRTQEIADVIQKLPELFTYYRSSGLIEYYDSYKEYVSSIPQTRAVGNRYTTWGKLTIYDGSRWDNWAWGFWIDDTTPYISIPDLNGYYGGNMNFDNKISSIMIETNYKTFEGTPPASNHGDKCRAIFFMDKNFGGRSVSYEGEPYTPLFKWSLEGSPEYNNGWSSLVFTFDWHQ